MHRALSGEVLRLCGDAAAELAPGPVRERVERIAAQLSGPLRVGVAGSVSAGKSTLVNALLGQKVAAVGRGETPHVVTWYRYHHHERAELELVDGSIQVLPLGPGPRAPTDIGVPRERVARMCVYLSNTRLHDLTVIDTPGGDTTTRVNDDAAAAFLGASADAATDADALIFVMTHGRRTDERVLARFHDLFRAGGVSAINAVGVLSKIDTLGYSPNSDPWQESRGVVARLRRELAAVLTDVIPVIGLLAETAGAAQLTEADAHALVQLGTLDPDDLRFAMESGAEFLDDLPEEPVDRAARARLLGLLDMHGLRVCLDAVRAGQRGATALSDRLREASGVAALDRLLTDTFARRADLLKAHAGIGALTALSHRRDGDDADRRVLRRLRGPLEQLQTHPELRTLHIIRIAQRVTAGRLSLPDELAADLNRLATADTTAARLGLPEGAPLAQVAAEAVAAAGRWGRLANDPRLSPADARQVATVKRFYQVMADAPVE